MILPPLKVFGSGITVVPSGPLSSPEPGRIGSGSVLYWL